MVTRAGFRAVGGTPLDVLAERPDAGDLLGALGCLGVLVRGFGPLPTRLPFGLPHPSSWGLLEDRLTGLSVS